LNNRFISPSRALIRPLVPTTHLCNTTHSQTCARSLIRKSNFIQQAKIVLSTTYAKFLSEPWLTPTRLRLFKTRNQTSCKLLVLGALPTKFAVYTERLLAIPVDFTLTPRIPRSKGYSKTFEFTNWIAHASGCIKGIQLGRNLSRVGIAYSAGSS
jgi:hypothetical protein